MYYRFSTIIISVTVLVSLFTVILPAQSEMAIIEEGILHRYVPRARNKAAFVDKFRITSPGEIVGLPIKTYISTLHNPAHQLVWRYSGGSYYFLSNAYSNRFQGYTQLEKIRANEVDSLSYRASRKNLIDSLTVVYGSENKALAWLGLQKAQKQDQNIYPPLKAYRKKLILEGFIRRDELFKCGYDISLLFSNDSLQLLSVLRYENRLQLWSINEKDRMNSVLLHELSFHDARDTLSGTHDPTRNYVDSSFFTGSIIYVALDTDSGLVINVNSGKVYNFTDRLELVGEITYDNERRLFIDDRDSGKLWVAGSVRSTPLS